MAVFLLVRVPWPLRVPFQPLELVLFWLGPAMVVIRNPLVVLPPPAGAVSASAACLAYTSGMGMPQLVSLVFGCVVTAIEFSTANTAALFAAVAAGSNAANIFGVGLAGTDHAGLTELVTAAIGRIGSVPRGAANSFTPGRIRDAFQIYSAQAAPTSPGASGLTVLLAGPQATFSNPALKLSFVALVATLRNSISAPAPTGRIFGRTAPLQGVANAGETNGAYIARDLFFVYPQLLAGAAPPAPAVLAPVVPAPAVPAAVLVPPVVPALVVAAPGPAAALLAGPPPPGAGPPAPAVAALVGPAPAAPAAVPVPPVVPAPVLAAPGPAAALLAGLPHVLPAAPAHPVAAAILHAQQRQAALAIPAPVRSAAGSWSGPAIAPNQQHWVSKFNNDDRMGSNVAFSLLYEAVCRSTTPESALREFRMVEAIMMKFSPTGEGGDMALLALRADCDRLHIFQKQDFHAFLRHLQGHAPLAAPLCDHIRNTIKLAMEDAKLHRAMVSGSSIAQLELLDVFGIRHPGFQPQQQPYFQQRPGSPFAPSPQVNLQPQPLAPTPGFHAARPPSGFTQPRHFVPPPPGAPFPRTVRFDHQGQIGAKRPRQPSDGMRVLIDMCMSAHQGVDRDRAKAAVLRYLRGQCSACLQTRVKSGRFTSCPTPNCTGFPLHASLQNAGKHMVP